jgi:ankyrin repeat protein
LLQTEGHEGVTLLTVAIENNSLDIVRCLIREYGADVNQAEADGSTALFIAARLGRLDVLRCLAEDFDADVNKANANAITPLCIAAHQRLVDELGADVNQANYNGPPLMIAACKCHLDDFHCLAKDFGADVN